MGKRGYTLIELVVVVALLGMMLVFSIPRLRHLLMSNDLNSTTRRIVGLVKELKNTAVHEYKDYSFYFDLNSQKMWYGPAVRTDDGEKPTAENGFQVPENVRILDVQTPSKGKQTTDTAVVRFSRKGYIEQTMIHLEGSDGSRKTLHFTPFLGEIKVYDKYVEFSE